MAAAVTYQTADAPADAAAVTESLGLEAWVAAAVQSPALRYRTAVPRAELCRAVPCCAVPCCAVLCCVCCVPHGVATRPRPPLHAPQGLCEVAHAAAAEGGRGPAAEQRGGGGAGRAHGRHGSGGEGHEGPAGLVTRDSWLVTRDS